MGSFRALLLLLLLAAIQIQAAYYTDSAEFEEWQEFKEFQRWKHARKHHGRGRPRYSNNDLQRYRDEEWGTSNEDPPPIDEAARMARYIVNQNSEETIIIISYLIGQCRLRKEKQKLTQFKAIITFHGRYLGICAIEIYTISSSRCLMINRVIKECEKVLFSKPVRKIRIDALFCINAHFCKKKNVYNIRKSIQSTSLRVHRCVVWRRFDLHTYV